MRYSVTKESYPGKGDYTATGIVFTSVSNDSATASGEAVAYAANLQSADSSGVGYGVILLGDSFSDPTTIGSASTFSGTYTPITITSNTFTLSQANDLIEVNKTTGSATSIVLPPMTVDHQYNVVDSKGDAGTNIITVTTTNGNSLINGASNYLLQNNNQSNGFVFDGTTTKIV